MIKRLVVFLNAIFEEPSLFRTFSARGTDTPACLIKRAVAILNTIFEEPFLLRASSIFLQGPQFISRETTATFIQTVAKIIFPTS